MATRWGNLNESSREQARVRSRGIGVYRLPGKIYLVKSTWKFSRQAYLRKAPQWMCGIICLLLLQYSSNYCCHVQDGETSSAHAASNSLPAEKERESSVSEWYLAVSTYSRLSAFWRRLRVGGKIMLETRTESRCCSPSCAGGIKQPTAIVFFPFKFFSKKLFRHNLWLTRKENIGLRACNIL